jgi:hypothetical protein
VEVVIAAGPIALGHGVGLVRRAATVAGSECDNSNCGNPVADIQASAVGKQKS